MPVEIKEVIDVAPGIQRIEFSVTNLHEPMIVPAGTEVSPDQPEDEEFSGRLKFEAELEPAESKR